jgi:NAD(P)-dependent dehydrogenase (short-subunit alcohol dehydrogenase family)
VASSKSFLDDLFGLKGKVAVVIGGGGVLGSVMAGALACAGAAVAVVDLRAEDAEAAAAAIRRKARVRTLAVAADVSDHEQVVAAQRTIRDRLGPADVLVNAAGLNSATPFFEISGEEWTRLLDVNLRSVFLACQVFGRTMVEGGGGGSIVNISSASSDPPLSKVFTYGVAKAGVNNLTRFLAREWAAAHVRVNAIAPGFFPAEQNRRILTPERVEAIMKHTPAGRFGEPQELVGALLWLASNKASSFVTGAIIRVDGGFTAMTI